MRLSLLWVLVPVMAASRAEAGSLPASAQIQEMQAVRQEHRLSCEYAAARAAAARWGVHLTENELIAAIPADPNPHHGFRGNIDGMPGGTEDYGVYPEPIAIFLEKKGLLAKILTGGVGDLKAEIARGRPVLVWLRSKAGGEEPSLAKIGGQKVRLLPYEHTMAAYGYDERGVVLMDPFTGFPDYYPWARFLRDWGYLGQMALSVGRRRPSANRERPGISPYFYRHWLMEGGKAVFGAPVAPPRERRGKHVQKFERARMEYDLRRPRAQRIRVISRRPSR